jgi:hypothetical protein
METLVCRDCHLEKSLKDDFSRNACAKIGYAQPCKTCTNTRNRNRRAQKKAQDPDALFKEEKRLRDAWRSHNPEKRRAQWRRQYVKHGAKKLRALKELARTHPEILRARRQRTKQNVGARGRLLKVLAQHRRESLKRQLPADFTLEHERFMHQYWGFTCAVCGNQQGLLWTLSLDHWIPLSSPDCPGTVAWNILPLCNGQGGCNNRKHDKLPGVWLREAFSPRKARTIEKAIAAYFAKVKALWGDNGTLTLL